MTARPRLAVFKFASCDGCQLQFLDTARALAKIAASIDIVHFTELRSRALTGPYDIGLVEGSISAAGDVERAREIRAACRYLVAIGACATAGGIQALRNWNDAGGLPEGLGAAPSFVRSLEKSTPLGDHVPIDFELRGCPIDAGQLLELLTAVVLGRTPRVPRESVCAECKAAGTVCVAVARGITCLGPVTQAGCGAICPAHDRECYGCYGPAAQANVMSLTGWYGRRGSSKDELTRLVRSFNAWAPDFRDAVEPGPPPPGGAS
ncbi:MAG: NAD-reducing hydrogenase HoxS subunit delta [Planctomycetota bacterium]|jgi:coenzyme F420-reducing hydrogenase gamma subunit